MNHPTPAGGGVPDFGVSRLLLVGTGSVSVSDLPFWAEWLRASYPRLEITTVITRSAERFVSRASLAARTGGDVLTDAWPQDTAHARHVAWAEWAEAVVVYPATLHFVARLALGLADTPAVLAAQCTAAPVAVAPALPPGGLDSAAYQAHWTALTARRNVVVAPPRSGVSATTGRPDAWVPALLPDVIELLEQRRVELAERASAATPLPPTATLLAEGSTA
ncbi:flavoprotein [Streptomyces hypolithicus]